MMQSLFDLFGLFVEITFGSIWLSYLGLVAIFAVISFLTRMSLITYFYIMFLFTCAFMSGYFGDLFLLPAFIFAVIYFSYSVIRYFSGTSQIGV